MKTAAAFLFLLAAVAAALKVSLDHAKRPHAPPPQPVRAVVWPGAPQAPPAPPAGPGGVPFTPGGHYGVDCVGKGDGAPGVVEVLYDGGNPNTQPVYNGVQVTPQDTLWGPYGSDGEARAAAAAIVAAGLCGPGPRP